MNHLDFDIDKARKGWLWGFAGSEAEGLAKEVFISLLEKQDVHGCFETDNPYRHILLNRGLIEECEGGGYRFTIKGLGGIYGEWGKR